MRPRNNTAKDWIYAFILGFYDDNLYPPSLTEIKDKWNEHHERQITTGFINRYLLELYEENKLVRRATSIRCYTLPEDPKAIRVRPPRTRETDNTHKDQNPA